MTPLRILLVDDSPEFLRSTRRFLHGHPGAVVVGAASTGEQAVQMASDLLPDLVFMDLYLPGINGIEATRQIKRLHPAIRVVVVTFYDMDEYVAAAHAAGAERLIPKAVLGEELDRILTEQKTMEPGTREELNILVVDDSPTMRKMIMASLKPLDACFYQAGNGLEAIEQLSLKPYHVMTLDLNMPDMHGLEVLQFIQKVHHKNPRSIVIISTRGDDDSRQAALQLGASAYLTKPFTPQDLLHLVSGLIA